MNERNLEFVFDRYLQLGQAMRDYAPDTIKGYQDTFGFFIRQTQCKTIDDATRDVVEKFLFYGRLERNWSPVTFRQHYKHFNTFFKWCIQKNYIEENPLDGIEKPRLEKKLPESLSLNEAQLVLDTAFHMPSNYRFLRYRNRAIVGLMLFAGLRKKEVINLKLNDVCLENKVLFIQQAKGAKDRRIPINAKLNIILKEYLQDRKRLKRDNLQFIIGLNPNRPFGNEGVKKLFIKLKANTKLKFRPHMLRHSFATLMLEGGCDIYTLSKMMGHEKISTTTIYLSCSMKHFSKAIEMHQMN